LAEARASVPREGRVVVFLLDVSTSMRPYQDEARSGVLQQIELLRPMDQFNVLAFSGEVSRFAEMPVAPGEDSLAAVRAWVGGLDERTGSDLGAGITQALGTPGVTSLVIYSDGRASAGIVDPAGLGALVASENRSHAQLFTVAFGVPAGAGSELFPGAARFAPPPAETRAEERPNDDLRP
jgi:Mg-chelatase subunit ChlD